MKIEVLKTSWFKGGFWHFNSYRFNGGQSYVSFRLFCLIVRIYG